MSPPRYSHLGCGGECMVDMTAHADGTISVNFLCLACGSTGVVARRTP